MFYETTPLLKQMDSTTEKVDGLCVLTPSEGKRLIGKALAAMPEIQRAMKRGRIVIARTTTCAFVAEELLKLPQDKYRFACGVIGQGLLTAVEGHEESYSMVLLDGELAGADVHAKDVFMDFDLHDVMIKSANAIDMDGNAGVLIFDMDGGNMGRGLTVSIRGSHLIVPTGLEKLVPSVVEASNKCGALRWRHSAGQNVGYLLLQNSRVVTEIEALAILFGVRATLVAAGGVDGSEGCVVLALEGPVNNIDAAFTLINQIKGEPLVGSGMDG